MTTFVLICLGIITICSLITAIVVAFEVDEIEEKITHIYSKILDDHYLLADIHGILYDLRALKQEKARKKYISYNERDLK